MKIKPFAFLTLALTASLLGAGCMPSGSVKNTSGNTMMSSGVRGTVTIGPTCPVERIPPDPQCADKPYATTFVITSTSGMSAGTVTSGADGTYKLGLAPGNYVIALQKSGVMPSMAPQSFTVSANTYTTLNLSLDSGIR